MINIVRMVIDQKMYPVDTMEDVIFSALSPNRPSREIAKRFSIETVKPEGVKSNGVHKMWAYQSSGEFVPVLREPFVGERLSCYEI